MDDATVGALLGLALLFAAAALAEALARQRRGRR
jgi:hypothetical protein